MTSSRNGLLRRPRLCYSQSIRWLSFRQRSVPSYSLGRSMNRARALYAGIHHAVGGMARSLSRSRRAGKVIDATKPPTRSGPVSRRISSSATVLHEYAGIHLRSRSDFGSNLSSVGALIRPPIVSSKSHPALHKPRTARKSVRLQNQKLLVFTPRSQSLTGSFTANTFVTACFHILLSKGSACCAKTLSAGHMAFGPMPDHPRRTCLHRDKPTRVCAADLAHRQRSGAAGFE